MGQTRQWNCYNQWSQHQLHPSPVTIHSLQIMPFRGNTMTNVIISEDIKTRWSDTDMTPGTRPYSGHGRTVAGHFLTALAPTGPKMDPVLNYLDQCAGWSTTRGVSRETEWRDKIRESVLQKLDRINYSSSRAMGCLII